MTRGDIAKQYFENGCNCAQAVVLAFKDKIDIDEKTLFALSSSFGGGFGRMREVCGAVSGMTLVAGFMFGYYDPLDNSQKMKNYEVEQKLIKEFAEINGSYICRELLAGVTNSSIPVPEKRTDEYYKKRPCGELVKIAADILEKHFEL